MPKCSQEITPIAPTANLFAVTVDNQLISINTNDPSTILRSIPLRCVRSSHAILGIDFRPSTGQLYALIRTPGNIGKLYTINVVNGAVKKVKSPLNFIPLNGTSFGVDFNPTVDRLRIVSNTGQNLRVDPNTGAVAFVDTNLTYPGGLIPSVVAAAYTNSFAGSTSTVLYDISAGQNTLVTQNPPNSGTLNIVGTLGVTLDPNSPFTSFDIVSNSVSTNTAFASLALQNGTYGFYSINLATGAATLINPALNIPLRGIALL